MHYGDKTVSEFVQVLASRAPVPGGGGAAALTGALGVALGAMVGNLTVGRKRYAAVEEDVRAMLGRAQELQNHLLELIDRDAACFEPLSRAYGIPREVPGRTEALEAATRGACDAPLEIMRCCCAAIELLEEMLEKGSVTLISDIGCGALCCKAALESAALNVFVNTRALADREEAKGLECEVHTMLEQSSPKAEAVANKVLCRLQQEG